MAMRPPKGGIGNEMKEKAMREEIFAQLGALRADAGVEQVACKDTCVGDYLTGKADALAVAMKMVESKALIESMVRFLIGKYFMPISGKLNLQQKLTD